MTSPFYMAESLPDPREPAKRKPAPSKIKPPVSMRTFMRLFGKTLSQSGCEPASRSEGSPYLRNVSEKKGGNVSHAAAAFGVSRNTVLNYAR